MSFNLQSDLETEELKSRVRELENEIKILKAQKEIQSVSNNEAKKKICCDDCIFNNDKNSKKRCKACNLGNLFVQQM